MIISTQFFSSFFLFLLQTMENNNNKITNKKTKIMNTVKKFKEQLALHSHEITERSLKIIEIANYENEDDIEYLIDCSVYFENLFQIFLTKYNIDQISGEPLINNSTFIENPTWLARKVISAFKLEEIFVEYHVLNLLLTILTEKILNFHQKNKIIKLLK